MENTSLTIWQEIEKECVLQFNGQALPKILGTALPEKLIARSVLDLHLFVPDQIPTLPAATNGTFAYGINNNGHIVGYYGDSNGNHGFLETTVPNPPPPPGTTADMILRGSNLSPAVAGQYEIYDIGNNAILAGYQLGQVGTDNWQLGGFAVDPPTVSGTFADMSNDQLVQAMAGFGGGSGAGESLNTAPLGAETSQQPLLTTPQHA